MRMQFVFAPMLLLISSCHDKSENAPVPIFCDFNAKVSFGCSRKLILDTNISASVVQNYFDSEVGNYPEIEIVFVDECENFRSVVMAECKKNSPLPRVFLVIVDDSGAPVDIARPR